MREDDPAGRAAERTGVRVSELDGAEADASADSRELAARLQGLLDRALSLQGPAVQKNIGRARQRNPDATPAEVIRNLEHMYEAALTGQGAAVGAAAAAPGVGIGLGLALAGGEALSTLELSALFALSLAEIHGVQLDNLERRRTLVLGVVLGGSGSSVIPKLAERTGKYWGRQLAEAVPLETIRQINKVLGRNFVTRYGTRQGIVVLGRTAPFGVGAAIGGVANFALAATAVRAGRRAFGPPPASWETYAGPAEA